MTEKGSDDLLREQGIMDQVEENTKEAIDESKHEDIVTDNTNPEDDDEN
jgi:hypothetical protein